jgi:hypothetical protein
MVRVFQRYYALRTMIENEMAYIPCWVKADTNIKAAKRAIKKVGDDKRMNRRLKEAVENNALFLPMSIYVRIGDL